MDDTLYSRHAGPGVSIPALYTGTYALKIGPQHNQSDNFGDFPQSLHSNASTVQK